MFNGKISQFVRGKNYCVDCPSNDIAGKGAHLNNKDTRKKVLAKNWCDPVLTDGRQKIKNCLKLADGGFLQVCAKCNSFFLFSLLKRKSNRFLFYNTLTDDII